MSAIAETSLFLTRDGDEINLGSPIGTGTVFIQTKGLDLSQDQLIKFLDRLLINLSDRAEQDGFLLEVFGSDDEDGPYILLQTVAVDANDPQYLDVPGQRFYKFRFFDDSALMRWRLHGFSLFGEIGGDEF